LNDIEVPLAYFDSDSKTYKTENLKLGSLRIIETSQSRSNNFKKLENKSDSEENVEKRKVELPEVKEKVMGPLYTLKNTFHLNKNYITYFLLFILLIIAAIQFPSWIKYFRKEKSGLEKFKKTLNYSEFNELLIFLFDSGDFVKEIRQSSLKKNEQDYLVNLVKTNAEEYM